MISEAWITDGCAMVRRLHEQGHAERAAELARYVEKKALNSDRLAWQRSYDKAMRAIGCSVRDCTTLRMHPSRPWCRKHAPRFDRRAA